MLKCEEVPCTLQWIDEDPQVFLHGFAAQASSIPHWGEQTYQIAFRAQVTAKSACANSVVVINLFFFCVN